MADEMDGRKLKTLQWVCVDREKWNRMDQMTQNMKLNSGRDTVDHASLPNGMRSEKPFGLLYSGRYSAFRVTVDILRVTPPSPSDLNV